MQDDVYLIAADGWTGASKPRGIIEDQQRKIKETPDLVIKGKKYKLDLIPPTLVVGRYFADRRADIEALQAKQEAAAQSLEEFIEEHSGDEGLLADAANDKGKITKATVQARLKQLKAERGRVTFDADNSDEIEALQACLNLFEAEADAAKAVKEAQAKLDEAVFKTYGTLDGDEDAIKKLVIDDKWLATMQAAIVDRYFETELNAITSELQRLTQGLAGRVKQLEERYVRSFQKMPFSTRRCSAHGWPTVPDGGR